MKRIIMLATVVAVALSSCSKIDDNEIINNKQYSITATIPGDLTRTSYTDMTAEAGKGLKVQWEENESISVVEVNKSSYRYTNVYTFTAENAAGATATFMAPDGFSPNKSSKYVAVYPAMQKKDTEGKYDYYAGDINSSTIALRYGDKMVTDFYNLEIYQDDLNSANHLKRYDAMFSIVEFNVDNAEINFIKLNTVIKWEISGLNAGSTVKEFVFETNPNFTLSTNGELSFMGILLEGNTMYSSLGSSNRFTMKLGNPEEGWTIPADGKLNIYMPMVGSNSYMGTGRELLGSYTFTLTGPEAVYRATATLKSYNYLDPGKVHVFKVKLSASE